MSSRSKNGLVYKKQEAVFAWSVLALPLLFYVVFWLLPNLLSVVYSFFYWDGLTPPIWVGFSNYVKIFEDPFLFRALGHNLFLLVFVPVLTVTISLLLSHGLVNKSFWENKLFQVLYFVPNVLAAVVVSLLWSFIYNGNFGILNAILIGLGFKEFQDFYWLASGKTALWALLPVYIWANVGFQVLIYVNAMKAIPSSIYESAELEGATSFQKMTRITLPLMKNILKVTTLFLILMTFKAYDIVLVLTGGGPAGATDVTGYYMFGMAFSFNRGTGSSGHDYGYASTIGMLLFVILIAVKLLLDRIKDDDIEY